MFGLMEEQNNLLKCLTEATNQQFIPLLVPSPWHQSTNAPMLHGNASIENGLHLSGKGVIRRNQIHVTLEIWKVKM